MKLQAAILDWAGTVIDFGSRAPVIAMDSVFRGEDLPHHVHGRWAEFGIR